MQQANTSSLSTPLGAATFIAAHANELAQIARGQGFDALGYLLEMAQLEAETLVRQVSASH
jgi:hypothetical protein